MPVTLSPCIDTLIPTYIWCRAKGPTLSMARDKPTTSSLTSSFFLSSLGSTWESHGGISYHSWMAKQESLTTTYFLHTLLPCDLISTLVDCKLHHFAVSSSIIVKPPHAPPNCSKNSLSTRKLTAQQFSSKFPLHGLIQQLFLKNPLPLLQNPLCFEDLFKLKQNERSS